MATQHDVAAHLSMSVRRVQQLMSRGVLPRGTGRAGVDLDACREAYLDHMRSLAAGHQSKTGELDLTRERARLAVQQAEKISMENASTRAALIAVDEYQAGASVIASMIRTRVMKIGAKLQHALAAEKSAPNCKALVDSAARAALEDLANTEILAAEDGPPTHSGEKQWPTS